VTDGRARDHIHALDQLMLAWFNQDWDLDYDDDDAVLRDFASVDQESAARVVREIDYLLAARPTTADLTLLHIPPSGDDPREGRDTTEWLRHVRGVLSAPGD
jgi:hypothetical protein